MKIKIKKKHMCVQNKKKKSAVRVEFSSLVDRGGHDPSIFHYPFIPTPKEDAFLPPSLGSLSP